MGLFSTSPTSNAAFPPPKTTSDGTPIAPNRSQRSVCWEHRDTYFKCLDRANIVDSIKESAAASKVCGAEDKDFQKNCAESWVTYFKKRRVMEWQKAETLRKLKEEGAVSMEGEMPPNLKKR